MNDSENRLEIMLIGGEYKGEIYGPSPEFDRYYHHFHVGNGNFDNKKLKNYLNHIIELENDNGAHLVISNKSLDLLINKVIDFMKNNYVIDRKKMPIDRRSSILPIKTAPCGCCYSIDSELRGFLVYE